MEDLIEKFFNSKTELNCLNIIKYTIFHEFYSIGKYLADFFLSYFPHSLPIKHELALIYYFKKDYDKCYDLYQSILDMKGLTKKESYDMMFTQHFCINHVCDRYTFYNENVIQTILNRKKNAFPMITFTITSCKRFDLFEQSVNSFLNCCLDLSKIDRWICVDDNSSSEDREKMSKMYPFFEFYFKTKEEKGHPRSMNIIRNIVDTPYLFHMEDDWKFFCKRNYLSDMLEIVNKEHKLAQCLVNKNYAEIESDIDIAGGDFQQTSSGLRFYIHEFCATTDSIERWTKKHAEELNNCKHCYYWPHFSFRPSLIRTHIFKEFGEFNEKVSHFEMDYSRKYATVGYESAFLEGIYSIHIGRLTSERHDKNKPNAYELNDEIQFEDKKDISFTDFDCKLKTIVINLDRRPDRMEILLSKAKFLNQLNYERFPAIDGNKLKSTPQLSRIFDGNDYNMRTGMVGCAMSHIKLYMKFIHSDYDVFCILEDDLDFVPNFNRKLLAVYNQLKLCDWDMLYLGHHVRKEYMDENIYNKSMNPKIEKWDRVTSLTKSMGGTGGYLISKYGALKLLNFINENGMTNGIDTVQQKSADLLNIYYVYPHLIYSECYRGNNDVDTDIQFNYDSLTVSVDERLKEEIEFYGKINEIENFEMALNISKDDSLTDVYYYKDLELSNIHKLIKESKIPCYTLDDQVIIFDPNNNDGRYFDRLGKKGLFNIDDALVYKE